MLSEEKLREWEALCEKATPGPWQFDHPSDYAKVVYMYHERLTVEGNTGLCQVYSDHLVEDAQFIETARDALPAVLAELRQLRAKVIELEERLKAAGDVV